MQEAETDGLPRKLEQAAIDMARCAGAILSDHFGKPLDVEYKDKARSDPVSTADKESQESLVKQVSQRFPEHGVLGEEGPTEGEEDSPAPDVVWVLDPLDGTKNYLGGMPVYAASVGVLDRGVPLAGAVYVPWPGERDGVVFHASKGGGAYVDGKPVSVSSLDEPTNRALATLPTYFPSAYRFMKPMRSRAGELRNTGSIAFDLAMVANGVLQYTFASGRLWDVAAGVILVAEGGGSVMMGRQAPWLLPLTSTTRWRTEESLVPAWKSGETTMGELRRWSAPLVAGSPGVIRYVTSNIRPRLRLRRRLSRAAKRLMPRRNG